MYALSLTAALLTLGAVPELKAPVPQAHKTIARGLDFLEKDALQWKNDKKRACATCHHGTMTVWALNEAKSQGFAVRSETLQEISQWTKGRFVTDKLTAPRDGPDANISMPAVYLALMARTVPKQESLSGEELRRIASYLARWQEADGFWKGPNQKDPAVPFFESVEVITLLAYLAVDGQVPADAKIESPIRSSRDKAAEWLRKTRPAESTQSLALHLLADVHRGPAAKTLQPGIDVLLNRQNADGGWGQEKDLPSDAYATGQALYALSLAGVARDRENVQRGVAFLLRTQQEDGSWPMKSRGKKSSDPAAIVYFGSAWATLGLMRSIPK
jgi:squalene-hopene/tetraprenyl-beta-curcumene cyclase